MFEIKLPNIKKEIQKFTNEEPANELEPNIRNLLKTILHILPFQQSNR